MKIAILDDYQEVSLKLADWGILPSDNQVIAFSDHLENIETITERLYTFEIVVAMRERTPFSKQLMKALPNLKLLVTTGMRNASIDMFAATELGIPVCGTRGGGPSTAELAWGLILALNRFIPSEFASVQQGGWQTTVGNDLNGKVLGLLGLGNLGSRMATIGNAFGMSVIAWSKNLTTERTAQFGARLVGKDEIFTNSDILSIHLKLSDRTEGIVGTRELNLMKSTAYLINTSRGPIVDEPALLQALQSNAIAGAGLDVFYQEPLPLEHPLRRIKNVIITPHLGYVTEETYRIFYKDCVEDILSFLNDQPVRVLNPDVLGYSR